MVDGKAYWGEIETRFGVFAATVDGDGRLLRFYFRAEEAERRELASVHDRAAIAGIATQVREYDEGKRRVFAVERVAEGTPFERAVWDALFEIPFGETRSYADIAKQVGEPEAARTVGIANARNPIPLIVPCHRVIGADGSLTGFGGGLALKRALLDFESAVVGRPRDLFAAVQ